MEMSIDEHMAQLKKLRSYHNGSYGASINFALDIISKYQKIEELAEYHMLRLLPKERMSSFQKDILEVLEDEND